MAHSLQTDMLGLLDRAPRSSKPYASSGEQGEAFRKVLDPPAAEQAEDKDAATDRQTHPGAADFLPAEPKSKQAKPDTESQDIKLDGPESDGQAKAVDATDIKTAAPPATTTPDTATLTAEVKAAPAQADPASVETAAKAEKAEATAPKVRTAPEAAESALTARNTAQPADDATKDRVPATEANTEMAAADKAVASDEMAARPRPRAAEAAANDETVRSADDAHKQTNDTTAVASAGQVPVAPMAASPSSENKTGSQVVTPVTASAETANRPARRDTPAESARPALDSNKHAADASKTGTPAELFADAADNAPARQSAEGGNKAELLFSSASPGQSAPVQAAQQQSALQGMRAHTPMLVAPAGVVDIVQQKLASDKGGDRVTVQLDPPELGRVSIDFKFDANGLQHVTITGETPEALKQLRQVHFQLTQALEQNGLSSQDMTFRQNTSQQGQPQFGSQPGALLAGDEEAVMQVIPAAMQPVRTISPGAGLDIKL
ncbi:MAG: flagellar hook-length control protein FliK [Henriciella sp.]|uniref:flagellar hook-length control protein FliK n=1 Tax=Henriciella sp. TaxID=1968823 RepID=UPI0032EE8835